MESKLRLDNKLNGDWIFLYEDESESLFDEFEDASVSWERGDLALAIKLTKQILRKHPDYMDAHNLHGVLFEALGDNRQAIDAWKRAVRIGLGCFTEEFQWGKDSLSWNYKENRGFLRAYFNLSNIYFRLEDYQAALKCLQNIRLLHSDYASPRFLLTKCQSRIRLQKKKLSTINQTP